MLTINVTLNGIKRKNDYSRRLEEGCVGKCPGGADSAGSAKAAECDPGIAGSRDRQDARGQPARRWRPRRAERGRAERFLGGGRVRESRNREEDARRAQPAEQW